MTPKIETFVRHFGEMGSKWGFNRTVGQIYALLVVSKEPLHALELAEELHISRGNVSMALKELASWQLVKVIHVPGDRKEYYTSIGSIWDMAMKVMEQRRQREIDPTVSLLRDQLLDEAVDENEAYALERMQEMHDLLEQVVGWMQQISKLEPKQLQQLIGLGINVSKVIEMKDKLLGKK